MTQIKLSIFLSLVLALLTLAGCVSTPSVYSDFDQRHDFTQDKSFTWAQDPPMLRAGDYPLSAIAEQRMTDAIKYVMQAKGYEFVNDSSDADLALVYTIGARQEIELTSSSPDYYVTRVDWGWGAYYFPYFVHFPFEPRYRSRRFEYPRAYIEGTVALDIFNAKTKLPIWHSKASKRLSRKDLDSHASNAQEIAEHLLKHFPDIGCEVEVSPECRPFN